MSIPEGLWKKCTACYAVLYRPELERALDVCPTCGHHLRVNATKRLQYFLDEGPYQLLGEDVRTQDPLGFTDQKTYPQRISAAQSKTDSTEALVVAQGNLKGQSVVVCVFEFEFMGGSMGAVVGERFAIAVKHSIAKGFPLVCFSASGGARMQEGLFSLFQMAKTSSMIAQLRAASLPYISVLTDPVYGGVAASLANLGDIIIAEPNTMVGFAGPRVIEQTVRETLPTNFQTSEFLLNRGVIDMVCPRIELRTKISSLLQKLMNIRLPKEQEVIISDQSEDSSNDLESADLIENNAIQKSSDDATINHSSNNKPDMDMLEGKYAGHPDEAQSEAVNEQALPKKQS